jgi:DNA-binding beta-propeller fold protein YncE
VVSRGDVTSVPAPAIGAGFAFNFPQSIAVDSANQVGYVVDTTLDSLLTVDLNTGDRNTGPIGSSTPFPLITQTPLPGAGSTAPFQDVALTPNEAVVTDSNQRSVYGFDTTSSIRRVISSADTGVGSDLQSPVSIAFDPATGTLFVVDGALFAVLAIEPVSGDRVIVSR